MEGQLAVHLPGNDPEEPAKLTDREILNMNKKKKKIVLVLFMLIALYFQNLYSIDATFMVVHMLLEITFWK